MTEQSARNKILDAAEMLFAEDGLHGVSLRQIAVAAGVPIGLIGYHFGSKDGLYRAVFERRSPTVVEQRLAGLRLADDEPDAERRLELIVKALVLPMVRLRTIDAQARFGRLMAREASDPNAFERGIIPQIFDPVAQEVVAALARASAAQPHPDLLGLSVHARRADLSDGRYRPDRAAVGWTLQVARRGGDRPLSRPVSGDCSAAWAGGHAGRRRAAPGACACAWKPAKIEGGECP